MGREIRGAKNVLVKCDIGVSQRGDNQGLVEDVTP